MNTVRAEHASTTAAARIASLRAALSQAEVHYYLATHTSDIRWLTGWSGVFDEEQAHLALIAADASSSHAVKSTDCGFIKTDTRYSTAMRAQETSDEWVIDDERIAQSAFIVNTLKSLAETGGVIRLGLEADLSLNRFRALEKALADASLTVELVELPDAIRNLRACKAASEITALKAAQAITDAAFSKILSFVRPGLSERRVASELEYLMRNLGADGLAFPSIVASGPNSAMPHAIPGERILQKGDFLLFDFGARKDGYCSDMTRTVVLGSANTEQYRIYNTVLSAQSEAKAMIRAGVVCNEPAERVNAIFAEAGFGELSHGLGHGVGLDVHEQPVLALKIDSLLEAGNVVTVEPGIYLEGQGGVRIEDFGLVTTDGFESFTATSLELIEL